MTGLSELMASSPILAAESYLDLLRSGPHWLFELTLEVVSAPLVFIAGRAWRNGLLRHLHHDLATLRDGLRTPAAPFVAVEQVDPPPPVIAGTSALCGAEVRARAGKATRPTGRVPLSWFSVPFGLSGLAGTWSYAAHLHLAPGIVGTTLGALAAVTWFALMAGYLRQVGGSRCLAHDLRDPTAGPFAALVLLTPALVVVQAGPLASNVTRVAFDVLVVLMIGLAGLLTGQWISGPLDMDRLHPGYFLPSLAGGYVASMGASTFGQPRLAAVMFGLGSISWAVLGTIVLARLMFRPPLPDTLTPTLAIQIAPAALATLAWLSLNGGRLDAVVSGVAGYGLLMVLAQVPLLPKYRRLAFSLGFWAFTFPVTATATATLHWLTIVKPAGGPAIGWLVLGAATLLVALIGLRTCLALTRGELRTPPEAQTRENNPANASPSGPRSSETSRAA